MSTFSNPYDGAPISAAALKRENPQAWADSATNVPPHLRDGAKQRRVVCAANRIRIDRGHPPDHLPTYDLVIGVRHHDPLMHEQIATKVMVAAGTGHREGERTAWRGSEQGFIDQWGTFMTREEALEVALAAGQRIYRCGGDEKRLYSECLY